jgi:sugar lactone lactonase YvrE
LKAATVIKFSRLALIAIASLTTLGSPSKADLWGLSVDPVGNGQPASDYSRVFRFDNSGNKLPNDIPSRSAGLDYPSGIAVGPDGNIYVSSVNTGSIYYYDGQTGAPLPSPLPSGPAGLFAFLGNAAPAQLAFGPDGNLYVSEFFGSNVRVYNDHSGANFGAQLPNAVTGLSSAGGIAFQSNGDLLVGDGFAMAAGQTAQIVRVHNGTKSTFGFTNLGGVYAPGALMTLPDDSLLIADLVGNYIAHYDANGNPQQVPFALIPPFNPPATNFPSDIKYDADGNLIVSVLGPTNPSANPADNQGALYRFDLNGNLIQTIASGLQPIGGLAWTTSAATLAGDYNGNGTIDSADYARWRADFGKHVALGNGPDGNADGVIDARDYVLWRKSAGPTLGAGSGVPEPSSFVLMVSGCLAAGFYRRGRRGSQTEAR